MRPCTLIIDLDGVVRQWGPATPIELKHGLPAGSLLATAFSPDLLEPAITGAVDDQQWRTDVAARLGTRYGRAGVRAVEEWSRSCGTVDDAVLGLVRQYRRIAPVVLLSNATSRLPADLVQLRLDGEFDEVFGSYRLGVAKPDPRVFELVCRELGTDPAFCVFVDDTAGHVVGARAAGLRAHAYRTPDDLAAFLGLNDLTIGCEHPG